MNQTTGRHSGETETETEIEITPAMKQAGALCYLSADPRIEDLEDILARVFLEMLRVK